MRCFHHFISVATQVIPSDVVSDEEDENHEPKLVDEPHELESINMRAFADALQASAGNQ